MTLRNRLSRPALAAAMFVLGSTASHGFISEPETLVYGRILNRANPNVEHVMTQGVLHWTLQKPDGTTVVLTGEVDAMDGGNFSYLVRIPHQAVMLGLQATPMVLPLGTTTTTASHASISFDGAPARMLSPSTSLFDLDQLLRASALRVDLEINAPSLDTDGDGIPDWWEDQYGLDKQNAGDALADANGNGLNNRAEYLAGNDPNRDGTHPLLLTRDVIAYNGSDSLVLLETADSDSTPAQLTYTLHTLPAGGRLMLRNAAALPAATTVPLHAGATFTQADVLAGRLIFRHTPGETPGAFEVSVRDQTVGHPESRGSIQALHFHPHANLVAATAEESLRLESLRLARDHGHLVADLGATYGRHQLAAPTAGMTPAAYTAHAGSYGAEASHIFLGGPADDSFTGGAMDDYFHGAGGSNTFTGGRGADAFIFIGPSASVDIVTDFAPAEGDLLDLSGALQGASRRLGDYVRIRRSGEDALVEISASGLGSGYADRVIRLKNSPLQSTDLANLYYAGNIEAGAIGLPPRITIASATNASENGPTPGTFVVTREGDAGEALTVQLLISGNATNGVDYQNVPSAITFPAGQATAIIQVIPYVDAVVELNETVFIQIAESTSYASGSPSFAQIFIEDLKPQLSLEVLDRVAGVADGSPGAILIRRAGLLAPELFVQFTLSGTAKSGTDYQTVTPYVTLAAGQTAKVVQFVPRPTVNFAGAEAKTIRMTLTPHSSYATMASAADLLLVPARLSYDEWLAARGVPASDQALVEYGFSLGPQPGDPSLFSRIPRATVENGYLTLRFRKKPGASDLTYQVQYSNDLKTWQTGTQVVEDVTAQVAPNDPAAAVYRAKLPMSSRKTAAMRVKLLLESDD